MNILKHKKARRVLASVLFCMALLLTLGGLLGCKTPSEPPVYDTRLNFLSDSGVSIYRIVYPKENCPATVLAVAEELQSSMQEALGVDVAMTDDHGTANATDQIQPYEILIGETARTATQNAMADLKGDEYVIRVDGHKIVIVGATNRATCAAVRYFMKDVIGRKDEMSTPDHPQIKIDQNYLYQGEYALPLHLSDEVQTTLPIAPYRATLLHTVALPQSACDQLTLATLQGLSTLYSSEQIFVLSQDSEAGLSAIVEKGEVTLSDKNDSEQTWTLAHLLNHYAELLDGYILCSSDLKSESAEVAINLAHQLNAVVVTPDNEGLAQAAGLSMVLDVRDKDDTWLRASEYFAKLSRTLAIEPSVAQGFSLVDYAVMTGCYYYDYRADDEYMHVQTFRHLEKGSYLLAMPSDHKHNTITFDALGVTVLEMNTAYRENLSVISGKLPAEWETTLFPQK
ncbi:MAG: hypothetical protein E7605_07205 [Ruminococcaceae bacterium]|nr:hypothetical protein [Oscillospiraceae bacterium]